MSNTLFGFLNVNKPAGMTSHDVVLAIRRKFKERSIGHLGTLDPQATGVLVLAVGRATRLIHSIGPLDKEYEAEFQWGVRSTTDDAWGDLQPVPHPVIPAIDAVESQLQIRYNGRFEQVPPHVSAVQVDGKRLYKEARKGNLVDAPPRPVVLHEHRIHRLKGDRLMLWLHVSSGFYIRSLARDLGNDLGCGGILSALTRTRVGPWKLTTSSTLEEIRPGDLLSAQAVMSGFMPGQSVDAEQAKQVIQGKQVRLAPSLTPIPPRLYLEHSGHFLAVMEHVQSGMYKPIKVFPPLGD